MGKSISIFTLGCKYCLSPFYAQLNTPIFQVDSGLGMKFAWLYLSDHHRGGYFITSGENHEKQ